MSCSIWGDCFRHGVFEGPFCPKCIAGTRGEYEQQLADSRIHPDSLGEAPDNNPKTRAGGMNKLPLHLIPPRAEAHVALAFADGGFKYQPYNWHAEPISASVYYGAMRRHINAWWAGEDVPADGVAHHLAHAACCILMILDTMGTDKLNDNRPTAIGEDYSELLETLAAHLPALRDRENTKFDLHDIA